VAGKPSELFATFVEENGRHAGTIRSPRGLHDELTITASGRMSPIVIRLCAVVGRNGALVWEPWKP